MLASELEALVYGRTYSVDFRFLALPKGLTQSDRAWINQHLATLTSTPEKLADGPRWAFFQRPHLVVFGIACMAATLIGTDSEHAYLTRDEKGRPLYLFAGYAAQFEGRSARPAIPQYGSNLDMFLPLIKIIEHRWSEKNYDQPDMDPTTPPDDVTPFVAPSHEHDPHAGDELAGQLNTRPAYIALWPDRVEQRSALWDAAIAAAEPISLCLGIGSRKAAAESIFLNGTLTTLTDEMDSFPLVVRHERNGARAALDRQSGDTIQPGPTSPATPPTTHTASASGPPAHSDAANTASRQHAPVGSEQHAQASGRQAAQFDDPERLRHYYNCVVDAYTYDRVPVERFMQEWLASRRRSIGLTSDDTQWAHWRLWLGEQRQRIGLTPEQATWMEARYLYKRALDMVYATGAISPDGRAALEQIRTHFGWSSEYAQERERYYCDRYELDLSKRRFEAQAKGVLNELSMIPGRILDEVMGTPNQDRTPPHTSQPNRSSGSHYKLKPKADSKQEPDNSQKTEPPDSEDKDNWF